MRKYISIKFPVILFLVHCIFSSLSAQHFEELRKEKSQNRAPIWVGNAPRIHGISLRFWDKRRNHPALVNGLSLSVLSRLGTQNGIQGALLFSQSERSRGVILSPLNDVKKRFTGISVVPIWNRLNEGKGISFSLIHRIQSSYGGLMVGGINLLRNHNGLSVGFLNLGPLNLRNPRISKPVFGKQGKKGFREAHINGFFLGGMNVFSPKSALRISALNYSKGGGYLDIGAVNISTNRWEGFQVGGFNYANHCFGGQLGGVNISSGIKGFQIGVVNFASKASVFQLGLINIIPENKGPFKVLPLINVRRGQARVRFNKVLEMDSLGRPLLEKINKESGVYYINTKYNEIGKIDYVSFQNRKGDLIQRKQDGLAKIRYSYSPQQKLSWQENFGKDEKPKADQNGVASYYYEYDERGNILFRQFTGSDYQLTNHKYENIAIFSRMLVDGKWEIKKWDRDNVLRYHSFGNEVLLDSIQKSIPINKAPNIIPKDQLKQGNLGYTYGGQLFTGKAYEKFRNGAYKELRSYVNGKMSGEYFRYFNREGEIKFEATYTANQLNGWCKSYFEKGKLKDSYFYESGRRMGEGFDFYKGGQIRLKNQYSWDPKSQKYTHKEESFYPSGVLKSTRTLISGRHQGEVWYYHPNSKPEKLITLDNNVYHGPYREWNDKGIKTVEGVHILSKRDSLWSIYSTKTGKVAELIPYRNGKIHGERKYFNEKGVILQRANYYEGLKNGRTTWYSPKGKVRKSKFYEMGKVVKNYPKIDQNVYVSMKNVANYKGKYYYKKEIFTGFAYSLHKRGQIRSRTEFTDGVIDGEITTWFANGDLRSIISVDPKTAKKNYKTYFKKGRKQEQSHYKGSEIFQDSFWWYKNGALKTAKKPRGDTLKITEWYPNKELKSDKILIGGQLSGRLMNYFENGKPMTSQYYQDGKLQGESIKWFKNGNMQFFEKFEDGRPTGSRKKYFPNGNLEFVLDLDDTGRSHGWFKTFYPQGSLKQETAYLEGVQHGPIRGYYKNGKILFSGFMFEGKEHDTFRYYNKKGELQKKVEFLKGKKVNPVNP